MVLLLAIAFLGYATADVQYSDSFARNVMYPLSAAAYSDQPQQCLSRLFPNSTASWLYGGRISRYFSDAFSHIWGAGMAEDFFFLQKQYPEYEVWITGHSLGGSLASLAASFLVGSHIAEPSKVKLVTFGQPRTGNSNFSETHNNQAFYKEDMRPDNYKICEGGYFSLP
ncbi:triacylglycerol lipase [Teladorsagia circumcincta]|uniref:Triacylglycerol lipase n=1 Tax=Teladorsagia circumcincta TaxID=45464 RepID=A0A2G9UST2_TELCI|nr:triacylglycerol lipase [Teladorsagia circumcincta]